MVKPSDSNRDDLSGQDRTSAEGTGNAEQQLLSQGVAALKSGDYDAALTLFEQLEHMSPAVRIKARMGKVQIFQKQGKTALARQHCQDLVMCESAQVRRWAQQVLKQLPQTEVSQLEQTSHTALPTHGSDPSGFVPLGPPIPQDKTGFQPLDPSSQAGTPPPVCADPAPSSGEIKAPRVSPGKTSDAADAPISADVSLPQADALGSLFHYQQLNRHMGPEGGEAFQPSAAAHGDNAKPDRLPTVSTSTSPSQSVPPPVASNARRLPTDKPYRLWAVQAISAVTSLWLIHWVLHQGLRQANDLIRLVRWPVQLSGFDAFERPHLTLVFGVGVLVILASPWALDRVLGLLHHQQSLSSRYLQKHHPEVVRLLRRVCRQRGWQMPELKLIPEAVPLGFSYGWSPRTARIVVSQGLLEGLTVEELSAFYAYEMSHIANGDMAVLSGLELVLMLIYSGYWHMAGWGDQRQQPWSRLTVSVGANLLYGLFWLLRKLGLWLSRVRGEYCDRTALAIFPYPDRYQQMLLTLTRHINDDLGRRGHLHPLLVSLDLLLPLSFQQATCPGSFLEQVGLPRLIAKDCLNPYRSWLTANNSHGILGERCLGFERWAHRWRLPGLGLTMEQMAMEGASTASSRMSVWDLAVQNGPLLGLVTGGSIALGLWFLGGLVNRLNWQQISWLYQDDSILQGGLLIGLGMGLLLRVNRQFPEKNPGRVAEVESRLFQGSPVLPVDGEPLLLEGILVGKGGSASCLGQNLYLKLGGKFLTLKFTSPVDWWRGFRNQKRHPASWPGRPVTVQGWQRRAGGRLWVEVASIQVAGHLPYRLHTPQGITGLGIGICLWGIWIIFAGG